MTSIRAVPDKGPDPKLGSKRRVSGNFSPYYTLDQSIEVAKVMHEKAGGSCDRAQLATLLDYNGVKNGAFLTRVTAAKLFGIITQDGDQLRVTDAGRAILHPVTPAQADRARVDAFLRVSLFRMVFDEFNGVPLPDEIGLKNLFLTKYQILPERVGPSVRVMIDSAEQAGFFRTAGNRTRMVMPLTITSAGNADIPPATPRVDQIVERRDGGGGNGGDGGGFDSSRIHPAIYGLIADLPEPGRLSPTKRDALVAAFTATVKFIYPDREPEA